MSTPPEEAPVVPRTITSPGEAFAVVAIVFGWFILASVQAMNDGYTAQPFTAGDFIGLMATELVLAGAALAMLRMRGFAIRTLVPQASVRGLAAGALLFAVASLAGMVVEWPFTLAGADDPLQGMMANAADVPLGTVLLLGLVNGTYEEVFLLGFLVRGLRAHGLAIALGVSLLVRGLCHLYQGPVGVASVLAFGAVLSLYFVASGRLFPVVVAHALADVAPFL